MGWGRNKPRTTGTTILAVVLLAAGASAAEAAPFAAVVPKEIQVDTAGPSFRVIFPYWGWIVCTGDSLTQLDMSTALITIETDKGVVTASHFFDNVDMLTPLRAGEAAGLRVDPWNAVMDTLLQAGEALKAPGTAFYFADVVFTAGMTDTIHLTSTLTMAEEELTYTTTLIFGDLGLALPLVVEGQRIASTPVPVAVEPATWGSLKARFLPGGDP